MSRSRFCLFIAPVVFLAACVPPSIPPSTPLPEPHPDAPLSPESACGAAHYQSLVGTPVDDAYFRGHDQLRIIPPDTAVTMDYSPTRLNIETDKSGQIIRIYCG